MTGQGQLSPSMLAQQAQMYGGVAAIPQVQRSEYLARALDAMSQQGPNIRTGGALATNLLAEALLQYGRARNDNQLMATIQGGLQNARGYALDGTGIPDPSAPSPGSMVAPRAPPALPQPSSPIGLAPGGGAPPDAASSLAVGGGGAGQSLTPGLDAANQDLARSLAGHGGALSPSQLSSLQADPLAFLGLPGGQITSGARSPAHNAAVGGVPTSEHVPGQGVAYDFIPPHGMSNGDAMARIQSSGIPFDQLIGEGNHIHVGWRPGGSAGRGQVIGGPPVQLAANTRTASSPFAPTASDASAPAPTPQSVQVTTGPGPSVPASAVQAPASPFAAPGSASPPGPVNSLGPAAPSAGPGAPSGPPTGPQATPAEIQMVQAGLRFPPGSAPYMQAIEKAAEIRARAAAPMAPPKDMMWGPNGQAVPMPGTQFQNLPGSPNERLQADPFGQLHSTGNPAYGPVPAGGVLQAGQGGRPQLSQLPVAAAPTFRIPGAQGFYTTGPDGRPVKVADDQFGITDVLKVRESALSSKQADDYNQSNAAYQAMVANAGKPNGMSAYAMRDTFARAINPGAVARSGTIQAIKESAGLPENLKSYLLNLQGDGDVSPQLAQQILDATLPFVQAHDRALRQLNTSNGAILSRYGLNPEDAQVPMDGAPTRYVVPTPHAAAPPSGPGNAAGAPGVLGVPGAGPPPPAPAQRPGYSAPRYNQRDGHYYVQDASGRWFREPGR